MYSMHHLRHISRVYILIYKERKARWMISFISIPFSHIDTAIVTRLRCGISRKCPSLLFAFSIATLHKCSTVLYIYVIVGYIAHLDGFFLKRASIEYKAKTSQHTESAVLNSIFFMTPSFFHVCL